MMRSPIVRVATSLIGAFLAFLQVPAVCGQSVPGPTLLHTAQGPVSADLKWQLSDDSVQRSRFDLQTRVRLQAPPTPSDLAAEDSGAEGVRLSWGPAESFAANDNI
jgi:hypothetical protein